MKLLLYMSMLLWFNMINKNKNFILLMVYMLLSVFLIMPMISMNEWMGQYMMIAMDNYSLIFIFLSIMIICLMFMVSNFINFKLKYMLNLLIMNLILILCFSMMNYLYFYLFFEFSLIPMFYLIMGWGYQNERINATMYMMFYTLFMSLPLLMLIFMMLNYFNSLSYYYMMYNIMYIKTLPSMLFYMFMIIPFLVKLPMFMFHSWLPKAHLEAPVSGSMLLAGVMLKLGAYGMIRTMFMMLNYAKNYNFIFMILSIFGAVILSAYCLVQIDMKLIVALSSVVHMSMGLIGLMSMMKFGVLGGFLMMFGHGLCSSGMFYLIQMNYEKLKSRNMFINKGTQYYHPTLMMWWFLFCMVNMSAPISLNLISEIFIMNSFIYWLYEFLMFMMIMMFLCTVYNLYLYSFMNHGYNFNIMKINIMKLMNYLILFIHWMPTNILMLKLKFLI
uniref:NADH-ubiquinone oxidoreductase chain 4 n=1 Tax=Sycobia sp. 2 JXW-2020 TaxID=2781669 RepID=A0A8A6UTG1_9HYME|nr:NADH dehydrogenase subunit 4 [Sycobia sp. 2 JXW-2020]